MSSIERHNDVAVFIGLDVGKESHHAVALTREGTKLYDKPHPNTEAGISQVFTEIEAHGPALMIVDQPATIGALPVAVARLLGIAVGYLPGLTMHRVADLHPGEAKTDARDAFIIAETARTLPATLRSIQVADEHVAELSMLCGFDDDLAAQITQVSNRVRGLLTQVHPTLERVLGPRLDHPAILDLIERYPSSTLLRQAGINRVATRLLKKAHRKGGIWARDIFDALDQQSVTVVGTDAAKIVLPRLAKQLIELRKQRTEIVSEGRKDC